MTSSNLWFQDRFVLLLFFVHPYLTSQLTFELEKMLECSAQENCHIRELFQAVKASPYDGKVGKSTWLFSNIYSLPSIHRLLTKESRSNLFISFDLIFHLPCSPQCTSTPLPLIISCLSIKRVVKNIPLQPPCFVSCSKPEGKDTLATFLTKSQFDRQSALN